MSTETGSSHDQGRTTDPRVERSRLIVRRAALAELGERGYGGFAIDSVAERAGVARSTIYRHWPDKLSLITDALEVLNQQPMPLPEGETPRARVRTLLVHLATAVTSSTFSSCIPAVIDAAEHNSEVRRFHHAYNARRRQALEEAVASGVQAGDFPTSLDAGLAARALAGTIFYQRLMTSEPFDPDRVDELIDLVLGSGGDGTS